MLRLLPNPPEASNNNEQFELEAIKKQLKVELVELGVDDEFLLQNFVIFDVKSYNKNGLNKSDVVNQTIDFLKNASILLQSIQYLKLSNSIDDLIAELSEEN